MIAFFWTCELQAAIYEGFTEPYLEANLKITERGTVSVIHVAEGAAVKAGELILELESRVLKSSLKIAEARKNSTGALAAAKARRTLTKTQLDRLISLSNDGHAQFDELAKARADANIAAAEVQIVLDEQKIYRLEYERLVQQIENRRLYAPFSGVVTRIYPTLGEAINLDTEFLATVAQLDKLSITLHVKTSQLAQFKLGASLSPNCPLLEADASQSIEATIEHIDEVINPDSGTIRVKLLIDNQSMTLRSGLKCSLEM